MAINKVVYGNNTLIDLSSDTVEASDVAQGKTFHLRSGAPATGTALGGTSIYDGDDSTGDLYNELFFGDVASGVDDVKVAFDMDLLWTNSAPTSDFAAQTLSLDLTNYSLFILISKTYKTNANNEANVTSMFIKGIQSFAISGAGQSISSGTYLLETRRGATFNNAGVAFENAMQPSTTNNNAYMIPYQIYGIR